MRAHHERTVQRIVAAFEADPAFPAVIVGGSVAKGWEREDSDVDILLVASEEEYARRLASGEVNYFNRELADYPGGYVDGKVIDLAFLEEVAQRGSEPARWAFLGAIVAYSRHLGLADLVARIPVYPEEERAYKLRAFAAHLVILRWFMSEAEKRGDSYLRSWAATNLVLYGGRLILAHNRLLFPYHKWFMKQLSLAPEQPDGLLNLADAALTRPGQETTDAFFTAVFEFHDWGVPRETASTYFTRESEWNWRDARAPLSDW